LQDSSSFLKEKYKDVSLFFHIIFMTETHVTFADLGLSDKILKKIEKKGYTRPSAIQAGVIPLLLNGDKDILGQAQTGTGKTASF